jgi:hypothetical protein
MPPPTGAATEGAPGLGAFAIDGHAGSSRRDRFLHPRHAGIACRAGRRLPFTPGEPRSSGGRFRPDWQHALKGDGGAAAQTSVRVSSRCPPLPPPASR